MNRSSFLCRLLRHTQLTASDRLLWWRLVQKEVFKLFVAKLILFLKCLFTQQGLGQEEILELDVRRVAGSRDNLSVKQIEKKILPQIGSLWRQNEAIFLDFLLNFEFLEGVLKVLRRVHWWEWQKSGFLGFWILFWYFLLRLYPPGPGKVFISKIEINLSLL